MAVQVQVTWKLVGDDELELTSEFGHVDPIATEVETDTSAPVERVLESESSALASGLAVQVA